MIDLIDFQWLHLNDYKQDTPTDVSTITAYYRCNVFFPKETRSRLKKVPLKGDYLTTQGLTEYWEKACVRYDQLASNEFDITEKITPVEIPILSWHGKRDMFSATGASVNIKKFGDQVESIIMEDWAHDFGSDSTVGLSFLKVRIADFLERL